MNTTNSSNLPKHFVKSETLMFEFVYNTDEYYLEYRNSNRKRKMILSNCKANLSYFASIENIKILNMLNSCSSDIDSLMISAISYLLHNGDLDIKSLSEDEISMNMRSNLKGGSFIRDFTHSI